MGEGGERPKRPAGYWSKKARQMRSAAARERASASKERRLQEVAARQRRDAVAAAYRRSAEARLAALPQLPTDPAARAARLKRLVQAATEEERRLARVRIIAAANWSHKNEGTPETHERASKSRQGALARLYMSGCISIDQLAWAVEIAMAAEAIERDVAVRTASLEARVDNEGSGRNALVEGIVRVRRQVAYTHWRNWIRDPKRAVLDMVVGDPKSYVEVARQYRMRKERARRLLIDAIDLWPDAMKRAEDQVDEETLARVYEDLL